MFIVKKIWISLIFIFTIVLSLSSNINALADEEVYTQDFSNIQSVKSDFTAYYVYTLGGGSEDDMIYESYDDQARWYLEDGAITRKSLNEDIAQNYGTNSIGVLTLTKKKYVNFELTVEYNSKSLTHYWPVVAFRQNEPGKYHLSDGAGVFVQNGGKVTLWGSEGVGGPYETSEISGYENNTWHTLKIRLEGINLSVYVDNSTNPNFTKTLNDDFFRRGYISLISVNSECSFRNLKITELPVVALADKYEQSPDLDIISNDSLNVLAGDQLPTLNELDYAKAEFFNANTLNVCLTVILSIVILVEATLITMPIVKKKFNKN